MPRPTISAKRGVTYTPSRGPLAGQTFTSERQYRNALAQLRGFASLSERERAPPRGVARIRAPEQAARERAVQARSLMEEEGLTLAQAARAAHTTPNNVQRYAGSGLVREGNGRYVVRHRDTARRYMKVLTTEGEIDLLVRNRRTARAIGAHWSAVRIYLEKGDDAPLRNLKTRTIRVDGVTYEFERDTAVIERLGRAGVLRFESIYV